MTVSLMGVPITSVSMAELLADYDDGMLVFHNLDTINKARTDAAFREVCQGAELSVIDGQVLRLLIASLWGQAVDKVSGSDFLPAFCRAHAADPEVSVFLLGAGPGVAAQAMTSLNHGAGRDVVVGTHSPSYALLDDESESERVIELINASGADTLAVGLGAPKQELWMARHRHLMPGIRRLVAVGATLDFEAGRVRRAPAWMSRAGLEWLFRLSMEPQRLWRRYLLEGPQVAIAIATARARELRSPGGPPRGGSTHHDTREHAG